MNYLVLWEKKPEKQAYKGSIGKPFPGTKKWYEYDHEATPQVDPNKPLSFQSVMSSAKKEYEEFMKEYSID